MNELDPLAMSAAIARAFAAPALCPHRLTAVLATVAPDLLMRLLDEQEAKQSAPVDPSTDDLPPARARFLREAETHQHEFNEQLRKNSDHTLDASLLAMREGRSIVAIKAIRNEYGMSLRDALAITQVFRHVCPDWLLNRESYEPLPNITVACLDNAEAVKGILYDLVHEAWYHDFPASQPCSKEALLYRLRNFVDSHFGGIKRDEHGREIG